MSEEDEIKGRSGEGLSREKRFKKRGVNNLSLFKYPTQVPVLLRGLGMHEKKEEETTFRDSAVVLSWRIYVGPYFSYFSRGGPLCPDLYPGLRRHHLPQCDHDGVGHGAHTCRGSESVFQRTLY